MMFPVANLYIWRELNKRDHMLLNGNVIAVIYLIINKIRNEFANGSTLDSLAIKYGVGRKLVIDIVRNRGAYKD